MNLTSISENKIPEKRKLLETSKNKINISGFAANRSRNELTNGSVTKFSEQTTFNEGERIVLKHSDTHNIFLEDNFSRQLQLFNDDNNFNFRNKRTSYVSEFTEDPMTPITPITKNQKDSINYSFSEYYGY